MQPIRKVVIPVAGWGTRSLPATKNIPKEMLPIYNKPVIQYVVEEAQAAGMSDVILITNRDKSVIEDHFDHNLQLEGYLKQKGKDSMLQVVQDVAEMVNIISIRQKQQKGLGHAISCARSAIGNEPFAIMVGDDLIFSGMPGIKQLIEVAMSENMPVVGVMEVPWDRVDRYGIVDGEQVGSGIYRVNNLVEKPSRDKAPSIPDDAALALVIEAIDNGCTSISEAEAQFPELQGKNITDADFGTVYDARMVVYSIGPRHNIVIPECSPAKEVAADFILYMATDKCLETYASETGGASLPFDYDYEQNETLWNSFSAMQKQRLQLFTQPDLNIMPNAVKYPLVLRGGFSAWTPCDNPGYEIQINGSSAQDIYDEVIQYWTENNSSRFNVACSQAGITG